MIKFELLCKQVKKSYIDKNKKEREYVETKFYLRSDELNKEFEITPYYREVKNDKGETTRIITNADTLKALSTIVRNF